MQRSEGQQLAYDQLLATAGVSRGTVEIGRVIEPERRGGLLRVEVSLDCAAIDGRVPEGIQLRGRERFEIWIDADFPFVQPSVLTARRRWPGRPHVHWGRLLCLYQAASEWSPHSGVYGLLERLDLWLRAAVANNLDPADAPLHPPVQYGRSETLVTVGADCPPVDGTAWIGFADLATHSAQRVDITGWSELPNTTLAALTILLPRPMDWEYPTHTGELFDIAASQGVQLERLQLLLMLAAHTRADETPMYVVIGSPMRRGHQNETLQHLAVWEIDATSADRMRKCLPRETDADDLKDIRAELRELVFQMAAESKITWCGVSENRAEIVLRRDLASPTHKAFRGKHVAVWGCGAIGGHVAGWIARAGARRITLYDNDIVTAGILVRQPYVDADIGLAKAEQLAGRLRQIRPDLDIDVRVANVLRDPLARDDWHDGADVLVDATASSVVRLKLEKACSAHPPASTFVVSLLFGHDIERGMAVVVPPSYGGGPEDALRRAKISCSADRELHAFAEEFWPREPRTEHFQPEPGCSDPTFRGSAVEAAAVSAGLLNMVAVRLTGATASSASAHLLALPGARHPGRREFVVYYDRPTCLTDGIGDYEIRLSPEALAEVRGWIARNDRLGRQSDETGGVLVGRRDETTGIVWIDNASGPPPDSNASPQRFECGTDGVAELLEHHAHRSRGESGYLGMWHTHPNMAPTPSDVDLQGMLGLVSTQNERESVMLIVGGSQGNERLGAYVFNGDTIKRHRWVAIEVTPQSAKPVERAAPPEKHVGLALSGGGSRALAFHLGCLRALHDRGVLPRIRVVSGVSGGALMTALYGYGPQEFEEFDARVVEILRQGLQMRIARRALFSPRLAQSLGTRAIAGSAAVGRGVASPLTRRGKHGAPVRRWASRTDAFEDVLRDVLGDGLLDQPRREDGLDIVINACDLRTGSAFRFGSQETSSSYLGTLTHVPRISTAVAASAAYPLLLPAVDRRWEFDARNGSRGEHRVALTDGGVYDNSGTSALRPGRSQAHTNNVFSVDHIIACDAGRGVLAPKVPFHIGSRTARAFNVSFRKLQDASRGQLHDDRAASKLQGFVMPYLGQNDGRLPWAPPNLVRREAVVDYPTDFKAMPARDLELLTGRGEQLTRLLVAAWCPDL